MKRAILPRASTGIRGLDEITSGGLPRGCPTLVCGPAGSGKTVLGLEFILRGATVLREAGAYISFDEPKEKVMRNLSSLGGNPETLLRTKRIFIDYIDPVQNNDAEVGEFDLSGLFARIDLAIRRVNAKRLVLDGADALFSTFANHEIVRKELGRLFRWLDSRNVTSIVTGEQGEGTLTRHGFEEYLADCVLFLDHRVSDQLSTRRLRVVKYRGAPHSADEFPFMIDEDGICVLPLTSLGLKHVASNARISTGIPRLDELFGGKGFFRGSTVLVSGTAGTGKSSIAATFINSACLRGEKSLYFAFEESQDQISRNMRSIGLHLDHWTRKGLLCFENLRPTVYGLELHLANIQRIIKSHEPQVVVIDPITNFISLGTHAEVKNMLMRLIDFLKTHQITALFTSLTEGGAAVEQSGVGVSSLIDTWLLVRDLEMAGERNRGLYILKSRGMAHSNQIREFVITDHGLDLVPVYVGTGGNVYIGAARAAKESEEAALAALKPATEHATREVRKKRRKAFEAELTALRAKFQADEKEAAADIIRAQRDERRAARTAEFFHRGAPVN